MKPWRENMVYVFGYYILNATNGIVMIINLEVQKKRRKPTKLMCKTYGVALVLHLSIITTI